MILSRMMQRVILMVIMGLLSMGPISVSVSASLSAAWARDITDATGTRITVPDNIAREFFKLFYQIDVSDAALARVLAGAQPGGSGR